ncbi:class II glutamine amidotransferase [Nocardioides sp. AN3]
MCRWMAYYGDPILADDLLFRPMHSIIDQSLHSQMGATTTNGDGFGIGWYGEGPEPAIYKNINPAWNDANLHEIARQVRSPLLFAHVRASTGTAVQRSNCHPFRWGRWLWMHNGVLNGFHDIKRDLMLHVDPTIYADMEGSTDSEMLFFLALSFGLTDEPVAAVERAVGLVEKVAADHGIIHPVQMTVATANGQSIWIFRYSSEGKSRTLFYSSEVSRLKALYPDIEAVARAGEETRLVVSEPIRDLPGAWNEVPESSVGIIQPGADELLPFRPVA